MALKFRNTPQRIFLLFIIILVVVGIGFAGGLLYTNHTTNSDQSSSPQAKEIDAVMQKIQGERSNFLSDPQKVSDTKSWWISSDNWSINVPTKDSLLVKVSPMKDGLANTSELGNLQSIVKEQLTSDGFVMNALNSSSNPSDTKFYDYIQAYDKADSHCVVTSQSDQELSADDNNHNYSSFTVNCFDDTALQTAYNKEIPFLKGLDDRTGIVDNIQVKGDKATLELHWRRTGAEAFMYQDGDVWKKIYVSQAPPACSDLQAAHIPTQYWIDCYEGATLKKGNF